MTGDRARERILDDHPKTLSGVLAAADAVAECWSSSFATERSAVVEPLESELETRDLPDALVSVLRTAVDATGQRLRAEPVAAPPYLAVTSRGPLARATTEDGRILVSVEVFAVRRTEDGAHYVRAGTSPEEVLSVQAVSDTR